MRINGHNEKKGIVVHACDAGIPDVEAGGSGLQDYPWLHCESKANNTLQETLSQNTVGETKRIKWEVWEG